jgi:hypothetical protein
VRHREVRVTGLTAGQSYRFALRVGTQTVASCKLVTLPEKLPLLGERPFIMLLGTCFAQHEDSDGKVGNAFFHMPQSRSPDIKLLAGDQVYLDSPWWKYLMQHSNDSLRDSFLEKYTSTWGQADGFARLLADGANYFCSDDHEYWNNAPNAGTYVADTWGEEGRTWWWKTASQLYGIFQAPREIQEISVPPLSVLMIDTRKNRDAVRGNFMLPASLARVEQWINALKGPGVLIVGQPLLWQKTGAIKGSIYDWNLPDFAQYQKLVKIIGASQHTLVVLTGDVHFGRVAYGKLNSGKELIEIISSPLSLVDKRAAGEWEQAPATFPVVPSEQVTPDVLARSAMVTMADFQPIGGHFLTLEFTQRGPGAELELRYWPVFSGGVPPSDFGKSVWKRTLS